MINQMHLFLAFALIMYVQILLVLRLPLNIHVLIFEVPTPQNGQWCVFDHFVRLALKVLRYP